jgi:hypothetical protein
MPWTFFLHAELGKKENLGGYANDQAKSKSHVYCEPWVNLFNIACPDTQNHHHQLRSFGYEANCKVYQIICPTVPYSRTKHLRQVARACDDQRSSNEYV